MIKEGKETLSTAPDVKNFVVNYTDGSQRIIEKGFFCEITKGQGTADLTFIMADCAGSDIEMIVKGCIELGFKLGILRPPTLDVKQDVSRFDAAPQNKGKRGLNNDRECVRTYGTH